MMARLAGWLDAILSHCVLERRFFGRRGRASWEWLIDELPIVQAIPEVKWFASPPPIELRSVIEGRYRDVPTQTLSWDPPTIAAVERLRTGPLSLSGKDNAAVERRRIEPRTWPGQATLLGESGQRVWILLHGWLGGPLRRDLRDWPCGRLLERADILHVVLPGHGVRRIQQSALGPSFPTRNPLSNAVGLTLAVAELSQLVDWLRGIGYRRIGIAGTSLGGYVAALHATVTSDVDRVILDRPLVRMSEPLWRIARRSARSALDELPSLLDAIYAPVSPFERSLRLPGERVDFLLGREDRIVGSDAAVALAARWGSRVEWFEGGHVLSLGRRPRLIEMMERLPA